jgi:hypothetical protein
MSQSESRVRTWVMGVRLSARERMVVQAAAEARGLTVAQLARELLLGSKTPRVAPGDTIHVVGPNCDYRVLGLETHGKGAELQLETVSGKDWLDARDAKIPA